jgi:c-opsin
MTYVISIPCLFISCSIDWQLKFDNNRSYVFYVFAMGLFVPTVVIVVSYSNILRVVRRVKREIRQRTSFLVKLTQKNRRSDAAEKRSTIMVAVMIGAFVVTWLPYSILALVEFFNDVKDDDSGDPSSVWLSVLPCLLAKTAVVLNPIIYGFLNTQVILYIVSIFNYV